MESTNLHHHHQLQDHQLVASSTPSSFYGASSTWTSLGPNSIGSLIVNPRDTAQPNDFDTPPANTLISQDLGFQWASSNITGVFTNQSSHDLHLARIKGEFSDSYQKFTEMLQSTQSNVEEPHFEPLIKHEQGDPFLRNFSSGFNTNGIQFPEAGEFSCFRNEITPNRGNFSQILPTINVSNLNPPSNSVSSNMLNANMQALDLFNSGRFVHDHTLYKESFSNYGLDHVQETIHKPLDSLNKMSPFNNGATEAKRTSTSLEPKAPPKKSRSESRASCPPFKVRKEKLGDRVAALQQLVAPFGKTDTASVLMEAIGYIKFLQNQVETLSVPYMKSSRNKSRTMMRAGLSEDGSEEPRRDLRSRGLCLVPVSCLSYVTDGGGGVWPSPNFSN